MGYFSPQLGTAEGAVADAHNLFDLKSAYGRGILLSRNLKLDVEFLDIVGWNLVVSLSRIHQEMKLHCV